MLWELTTVEVADDPSEIAAAAIRLLENEDEAVELAQRWIDWADAEAARRWHEFISAT